MWISNNEYASYYVRQQIEIIDDWMFDNIKQDQYLRHIGRGNTLRKTFFNQIISTYNQGKIESSLEAIKELVVAYDTTTIKYD
jgi:CHASE3 domain sensor protein